MKITWDQNKNLQNQKKHGVRFEDALTVFDDPLQLSILDQRMDAIEDRWVTVGGVAKLVVIVVVHTYMSLAGEELIRIISARKATRKERRQYEDIQI
jgi:uncharacterized DUF497 family protein